LLENPHGLSGQPIYPLAAELLQYRTAQPPIFTINI